MKVFFQYCLVGHVVATAFIFGERVIPHPKLSEIVNNHRTKRVALNIEIGHEKDASRFAIKDLVFDLNDHIPGLKKNDETKYVHEQDLDEWEFVEMPSQDGIHKECSGGSRSVTVVKKGQFVNEQGVQNIKTKKGTWELVWMKDNHAGSLNIGFEIPKDYTRNERTLPKGNICINFLVWSRESLRYARAAKEKAIRVAKEKLEERKQEIIKMKETPNPFMKALHYRNAYAATEEFHFQPLKYYEETVPDEGETIELQEDVIISTKGKLRVMETSGGDHSPLGTCKLTLMSQQP